MGRLNIVLDYDGTFLPFIPYDSEQFLLRYLNRSREFRISPGRKLVSWLAVEADRLELAGHSFKKYFNWVLEGVDASVLDRAAGMLADHIPDAHVKMVQMLSEKGADISIISCGTGNLCVPVLDKIGVSGLFSAVVSNFLIIEEGRISGMKYNVLKGEDKVLHAEKIGYRPENTAVVGDGYTDIPLLDWCGFPVFLDPGGRKRKKIGRSRYFFIDRLPELTQLLIDSNLLP